MILQVGNQKYSRTFKKLIPYLAYSQIWLSLPYVDDHNFGYITKLTKKQTIKKQVFVGVFSSLALWWLTQFLIFHPPNNNSQTCCE
jgi:hypothetical protein